MIEPYWNLDQPGKKCVLSGNEAAARGALESGVQLAASYPGSPSVQIIECLAAVGRQRNLYVEWSINEKVALEVAAAGSFAGIRALAVMKADGLNVAMDFLTTLSLSGIQGGLVIIVADDPGAHSSIKEEDSRYLAPPAHIPLLEPTGPAQCKDMLPWCFDVSEEVQLPIILRLTTRICHARATVKLGGIEPGRRRPQLPLQNRFITAARFHSRSHQKLETIRQRFESSPFNSFTGPEKPRLTVFASGVSFAYAREAVERLDVGKQVALARIGTIWPLPEKFVIGCMKHAASAVFFEEIEPFLEEQIKSLAAQHGGELGPLKFLGKQSDDVPWVTKDRGMGELDPDTVAKTLATALGMAYDPMPARLKHKKAHLPEFELPQRLPSLCAGCPHRASFWAIQAALAQDGRQGFTLGDIGCYALGVMPTGFQTLRTVHSMGSGLGIACGLGKLGAMGLDQPVVAVIGDSTFYHAGIPALMNAKFSGARFLCIILDNQTTAMTGHQPHPGIGLTAMGEAAAFIPLAEFVRSMGIPVTVLDPYRVAETTATILQLLEQGGLQVLLLKRECALTTINLQKKQVMVDPDRCLGDQCGCNRLCSRVFSCPANIWDEESGKAMIDDVLCTGCGVCAAICPQGAIVAKP